MLQSRSCARTTNGSSASVLCAQRPPIQRATCSPVVPRGSAQWSEAVLSTPSQGKTGAWETERAPRTFKRLSRRYLGSLSASGLRSAPTRARADCAASTETWRRTCRRESSACMRCVTQRPPVRFESFASALRTPHRAARSAPVAATKALFGTNRRSGRFSGRARSVRCGKVKNFVATLWSHQCLKADNVSPSRTLKPLLAPKALRKEEVT
eukprot:scaffold986_cov237-Pinguiococcus_pyrenoidosus.AAC.17